MEMGASRTGQTAQVLEATMKNVMKGIIMTMETKEQFDGRWLPTLDVSLSVSGENQILYKFFEKETTTNLTVQKRAAMGENQKVQILSNEVT